jgi:hypothetical protein
MHSFFMNDICLLGARSANDAVMSAESELAEDTEASGVCSCVGFGRRVGVTRGEAGLANAASVGSVRHPAMAPCMYRG